jgi:hypothetical protein
MCWLGVVVAKEWEIDLTRLVISIHSRRRLKCVTAKLQRLLDSAVRSVLVSVSHLMCPAVTSARLRPVSTDTGTPTGNSTEAYSTHSTGHDDYAGTRGSVRVQ